MGDTLQNCPTVGNHTGEQYDELRIYDNIIMCLRHCTWYLKQVMDRFGRSLVGGIWVSEMDKLTFHGCSPFTDPAGCDINIYEVTYSQ